jgi:hypothetical protein
LRIIHLCDDGKDGGKVSPCCQTEEKEENMEGQIVLYPLKGNKDQSNSQESESDGSLVSPDRDKPTRDEERGSITYGVGGDQGPSLSMREGKRILDERQDG